MVWKHGIVRRGLEDNSGQQTHSGWGCKPGINWTVGWSTGT